MPAGSDELASCAAANDSLAPVSELQLVEEAAGKRWELQEKGLFRVPLLLSFFSSRRRDPVVCIGQRPAGMFAARRAQERPGFPPWAWTKPTGRV